MSAAPAEEALNQIKEKGYADKYRMSGKKIVLIGAVFNDEITADYDENYTEYWRLEKL